jgi:hypothetical protein
MEFNYGGKTSRPLETRLCNTSLEIFMKKRPRQKEID